MPILPIDLQTIFGQMGTVGKEQATQRDVAPLQQALQGTEIVQQTIRQDSAVNETLDSREGERIDEQQRQGRRRGQAGKRKPAEETGTDSGKAGEAGVFRDPALGSHVDLVR